jgi:hypothetical protein
VRSKNSWAGRTTVKVGFRVSTTKIGQSLRRLDNRRCSAILFVCGHLAVRDRVVWATISDVAYPRGRTRRVGRFRTQALEVPAGVREGLLQARILEFELVQPIDRGNNRLAVPRRPRPKHHAADKVVPARLYAEQRPIGRPSSCLSSIPGGLKEG